MKNSKPEIEENIEQIADKTKRDFMKKFGSYAASVPLAGFVLMTAGSSVAHAKSHSCGPWSSHRPWWGGHRPPWSGHGNGHRPWSGHGFGHGHNKD